jgi:hypothetical protein
MEHRRGVPSIKLFKWDKHFPTGRKCPLLAKGRCLVTFAWAYSIPFLLVLRLGVLVLRSGFLVLRSGVLVLRLAGVKLFK